MKRSNIILLVVIAIAVAVIFSMVGDFSTYQTFATASHKKGKEFHVIGKLAKNMPMVYNPKKDANYFSFYVKDKSGDVNKVVFQGAMPEDFKRSQQIVLAGHMGKNNVFQCSHILMKCPSKYTPNKQQMNKEIQVQASM